MFAEERSGGQVECGWESTCSLNCTFCASEMEELRSTNDLESWAAVDLAFAFAVLLTIITLLDIKC